MSGISELNCLRPSYSIRAPCQPPEPSAVLISAIRCPDVSFCDIARVWGTGVPMLDGRHEGGGHPQLIVDKN